MTDTPQPEIVFTFTALDDAVVVEAEAVFGQDDVSLSKRMTGGALVDVFIRPVVELIGKILDFRAKQGNRITNAKVSIGKEQVSLEGYGVDDAERLLNSEASSGRSPSCATKGVARGWAVRRRNCRLRSRA
ncbi:MAG TPA: hypothetical protein VFP80_13365 [Thermoanaerobaculia bacterium]|nr:hypothetical protein [Thermoanaerobaculia bacterium]